MQLVQYIFFCCGMREKTTIHRLIIVVLFLFFLFLIHCCIFTIIFFAMLLRFCKYIKSVALVPVLEGLVYYIDPFHKWLPIINSFVSIKISLTNLVFKLIIQKNFYSQTRLERLNAYRRILNWQPFEKGLYFVYTW